MATRRELELTGDTSYTEILRTFKTMIHLVTVEEQADQVDSLISRVSELLNLGTLLTDQLKVSGQTQRKRVLKLFDMIEPAQMSDQDVARRVLNLLLNFDDPKEEQGVSNILIKKVIEGEYQGRARVREIQPEPSSAAPSGSTDVLDAEPYSSAKTDSQATPPSSSTAHKPGAIPKMVETPRQKETWYRSIISSNIQEIVLFLITSIVVGLIKYFWEQ